MRLALFQPDIPQNLGGAIRLAACLGVPLDVIRPTAFPLGTQDMRRAAMDYADRADMRLHAAWEPFRAANPDTRIILLTTAGETDLHDFAFRPDDILLMGRESAGVPDHVHAAADHRIRIAMADGARSLNVVVAAGMALGEALRQTR
ncbi:tRNA (cytidine(34)-2'-O)-methyltransferase [Minwuia sp.]|uniref:tRNA (cytidine(34)-2'-O)-methyltransferase n=1 Tax=Minwuia sp. TaxID=2493630 RepID=UPI003A8D5F08